MSLVPSHNFIVAGKKALATFLFASIGALGGSQLFNADVATWKAVASAGVGATLNLIYRWAEKAQGDF